MSNMRYGGSDERTKISNPSGRGHSIYRDRATGRGKWSGRGRGGKANAPNPGLSGGGREEATNPGRLRPTHFLALPLINYPGLTAHIKDFQRGLFSNVDGLNDSEFTSGPARGKGSKVANSSLVEGLDSSIVIDPRRLHMTLGVMALAQDDGWVEMPTQRTDTTIKGHFPKKTVSTALYLLNSLKPRISEILNRDKGIKVPLEVMHVLKTEKMWMNTKEKRGGGGDRKETSGKERNEVSKDGNRGGPGPYNDMQEKNAIGAGVLYVAPEMKHQSVDPDLRKLIQVSDLVHRAFKDAGYLTDTRPLKLHCTILNTSYRKSRLRQPFSYSDILMSDALRILRGKAGYSKSQSKEGRSTILVRKDKHVTVQQRGPTQSMSALQPNISSSSGPSSKVLNAPIISQGHSGVKNPPSVSVNLGVFVVEEIQLWVMGSHGPNNEYINCGGVVLE